MSGALIFVVALVVVALVLVFAGVKTVSQGSNWTIERFGRYTRTLPPGLHIIVPFMDTSFRGSVLTALRQQDSTPNGLAAGGQECRLRV